MSASLVGSEMCIRDSSRGVNALRALASDLQSCLGSSTSAPCDVAMHDWSVSYTHLTLPTICSV
eukprot:5158671-Alexandrium_andersonii.AAC.1